MVIMSGGEFSSVYGLVAVVHTMYKEGVDDIQCEMTRENRFAYLPIF